MVTPTTTTRVFSAQDSRLARTRVQVFDQDGLRRVLTSLPDETGDCRGKAIVIVGRILFTQPVTLTARHAGLTIRGEGQAEIVALTPGIAAAFQGIGVKVENISFLATANAAGAGYFSKAIHITTTGGSSKVSGCVFQTVQGVVVESGISSSAMSVTECTIRAGASAFTRLDPFCVLGGSPKFMLNDSISMSTESPSTNNGGCIVDNRSCDITLGALTGHMVISGNTGSYDITTTASSGGNYLGVNNQLSGSKSLHATDVDLDALIVAGLSDGDKGDIVVSATASVFTIDANVVSNTKLADMTDGTIKGRALGAGTGDPTDLTPLQARTAMDVYSTAEVVSVAYSYSTFYAAAAVTAHEAAADPHTGYQKESEKAAASGYASLDGSTKVPIAQIPTGTTSTTVLLGDALSTHEAAADPHTGYQKESEKDAISGYCGLDVNARIVAARMPALTGDVTTTAGGVATTIGALKVTNGMIAANTIYAFDKLVAGSISATELASGSVTTVKIVDLNVTTGKINDLAVTTGKLAASAVTEAKMLLADNTTHNVSTSMHGFAPKCPNDAVKKYLTVTSGVVSWA